MAILNIDLVTGIVFVVVFTFAYILMGRNKGQISGKRYPPSLPVLPLIGSMPFLPRMSELPTFFTEKSKQLGNVFGFRLGKYNIIVLNGREAIHEALVKRSTDFANRPKFLLSVMINKKLSGVIEHQYNSELRHLQQLTISILKEFGFGQGGIMETRIQMEVDDLISSLRKVGNVAEGVHPEELLTMSVLNVIASIMFGARYEHGDPQASQLVNVTQVYIRESIDANLVNFFPWMMYVVPYFRRIIQRNLKLQQWLTDMFTERIETGIKDSAEDSFIKSYVEAEGPDFDRSQLEFVLRDLMFAGAETSSTSLQWAFVMLANHQVIQARLSAEIDCVVPRSRPPSLDDRASLPYVEAAILELMRWKTVVPLALPHSTACDTEVGGYFVPADTLVFINLHSAHMDPRVWPEPEEFRPERFLDDCGKVINREQMITFSLGRRSCLGELLARQEVYLFFTGILQQFQILPPEGQQRVDVIDNTSVTLSPSHYQVRFVPRATVEDK